MNLNWFFLKCIKLSVFLTSQGYVPYQFLTFLLQFSVYILIYFVCNQTPPVLNPVPLLAAQKASTEPNVSRKGKFALFKRPATWEDGGLLVSRLSQVAS